MASIDLDGEDEREIPLKRSPERTNASMSAYCEATVSGVHALFKIWLIVPYGNAGEAINIDNTLNEEASGLGELYQQKKSGGLIARRSGKLELRD